ncbi:TetR/AcrR family transcriptional regulator [Amorphoplanes nipponensis]|uniref:TetR family transcriptional regulator n=1 Tax=Actinoplanes nipponensis TaxID=135950 RepID=A0A919JJZ6_9ACTN|nr:TetR/AcrR family transcriptional regulator [Actinoplanes nipponensis]GIE50670.1 TetR family transcriptional regulator [Actinoplanes nipponensis]
MARTAAPGARERILAAVSPLFYAEGIRAVGMARVVAAAGCGKNLVYSHFPAKSELVAAYLTAVRSRRERSAERAVAAAGEPAAGLVALVAEVADRVREPGFRGCALRNYLTECPAEDDTAGRIARDYLDRSRATVDGLVRSLGGEPALADRVWLVVEGLYAVAGRPDAARQADAAVELVRELVSRPAARRSAGRRR